MNKFITKPNLLVLSLFVVSFVGSYGQSSIPRTSAQNVEIERQLHDIVHDFDFAEKLIESGKLTYNTDYEKFYLERFVKQKTGNFFREVYHQILEGDLKLTDALPLYKAKYKEISSIPNLQQQYDVYINAILAARNAPTPENGADAPEGGNRTPNQPCTNLDFEDGTWSTWDVFNGQACDTYLGCITNVVAGTASNGGTPQHLITTGGGMDPGNGTIPLPIPIVSPFGGTSSLRLGNEDALSYAEYIENTFLVTAANPYFSYEYAVVIENPSGHGPTQMPFFMIEFYDASLNAITDSCGNYYVDPTTPIAKQTFDSVTLGSAWAWWFYKDWARITVDLTPYIGQNVTIRFTTSDCTFSGHLGRAYIDASCHTAEANVVQDCQGIRIQAPMGYHKYRWYSGNPSDSSTIVVLPGDTLDHLYIPGPGWYSVDLISETGCVINVDTIVNEIYIKAGHNVTYTEPTCYGASDGSITISPYGGTLPYQFSIDNGVTWQPTPNFQNIPAGTYNVITHDSQGCGDTLFNLIITEPSQILPNLNVTNATCFEECTGSANAVPTGGTSPSGMYRIEWNGVNLGTNQVYNLCPGNHLVTITDEAGCMVTENFIINDKPPLVIDQVIVDDEICYNNCDGRITIIDPDAVAYSIDGGFTWRSNNIFSNLCAQAAPYTVAIRNIDGCKATQVVNMNQPPPLQIEISPDTIICLNEPAILTAAMIGGTPPYGYQWAHGKTTQTITEIPLVGYTPYSVVVTDANGCWVQGETSVTLYPQPKADFDFTPGPETDIFRTLIEFENQSTSSGPLLYEWYFDVLGTSNLRDDFFKFPAEGGKWYTNCLKIENENGCRDSICKDLYVNFETLVYVPNTFTPDADGVNDEFLPITEGLNPEGYTLYIFNRWGDLIFTTSKLTEGWDGTHEGTKVKQDSYVWRIVAKRLSDDSIFEQIGHVNLLR